MGNRFTLKVVLLCLVLACSGCATKWQKPGATEQEFEVTKAGCVSRAYSRFPAMNRQVQIGNGYVQPSYTNCNGFGGYVNCTTTGGQYVPPVVLNVDDNASARNQDFISCLYENGWSPVKNGQQNNTQPEENPDKAACDSLRQKAMDYCNKVLPKNTDGDAKFDKCVKRKEKRLMKASQHSCLKDEN